MIVLEGHDVIALVGQNGFGDGDLRVQGVDGDDAAGEVDPGDESAEGVVAGSAVGQF